MVCKILIIGALAILGYGLLALGDVLVERVAPRDWPLLIIAAVAVGVVLGLIG